MSKIVSETRKIWMRLNSDAHDPAFLVQKTSGATPEKPEGSVVGDNVWYFDQRLTGSPNQWLRRIEWDVRICDGCLTAPQYDDLLRLSKSLGVAFMNKLGRFRHLSLATVKANLAVVLDLVAFVASGPWKEGRKTLAALTPQDGEAFVRSVSTNWRPGSKTLERLGSRIKEIQRLGVEGYIHDRFDEKTYAAIMMLTGEEYPDGAADKPKKDEDPNGFSARPFSNEYCLSFLEIHDFYMSSLAEDICLHISELAKYQREEPEFVKQFGKLYARSKYLARQRYKEFLKENPFRAESLPFVHHYRYPVVNSVDLITLAMMLQIGNLQRVAMSNAGREGELLWMEQGCLSKILLGSAEVDFISSRRYKNSSVPGGDSIGWPVSTSSARAVKTQERLAAAADSPYLWLGMPFKRIDGRLGSGTAGKVQRFAMAHELDVGPGGTAYVQRFRPTMALLLMTAEKGHPHLVKRALGHGNLETTLSYLQMNPYLQADLAIALRGLRELPHTDTGDLRIERRDGDLDVATLENILIDQQARGMVARILAPDVIAFAESSADIEAKAPSDPGALRYALERALRRDVRSRPILASWFESEAIRISIHHPGAENDLSARLGGLLETLCLDTRESAGAFG